MVSEVGVIKGESEGKLALGVAVGRTALGTLFGTELGNASGARVIDGARGRVDSNVEAGKDVVVKFRALVVAGTSEGGYSGKFEPGKVEAPVGTEALNPEYCIDCCMEGGIESPGGGRSKDCWCN